MSCLSTIARYILPTLTALAIVVLWALIVAVLSADPASAATTDVVTHVQGHGSTAHAHAGVVLPVFGALVFLPPFVLGIVLRPRVQS